MIHDDLITSWLPKGDYSYFRCDDGTWGVRVYHPGTIGIIATIGTGMDKTLAAWLAENLKVLSEHKG